MRLELRDVRKGSERNPALEATSALVTGGTAVLVEAETEQRPTVLGLIASGRMRPDAGSVLVNGRVSAKTLRDRTALVDAPDVSDHDPNVLTIGVVQEELMYAGLPSGPRAARRWLADRDCAELALRPIGTVRPSVRIRLLCELAAARPGIEAIVLVSPDRHGGRPQDWWVVAEDLAARGLAVLVIAGRASWQVLVGADDTEQTDEDDAEPQVEDDAEPVTEDDAEPEADTAPEPPADTPPPLEDNGSHPTDALPQPPAPLDTPATDGEEA